MGEFLRRHLLAMDVRSDIYGKRRFAICRSVDIAIYTFALIRTAGLASKGQPGSKVNVNLERANMVSY